MSRSSPAPITRTATCCQSTRRILAHRSRRLTDQRRYSRSGPSPRSRRGCRVHRPRLSLGPPPAAASAGGATTIGGLARLGCPAARSRLAASYVRFQPHETLFRRYVTHFPVHVTGFHLHVTLRVTPHSAC